LSLLFLFLSLLAKACLANVGFFASGLFKGENPQWYNGYAMRNNWLHINTLYCVKASNSSMESQPDS